MRTLAILAMVMLVAAALAAPVALADEAGSKKSKKSSGSGGSSGGDAGSGGTSKGSDTSDDAEARPAYYEGPSKASKRKAEPIQSIPEEAPSASKADRSGSKDRPMKLEMVGKKDRDKADEVKPTKIHAIARSSDGVASPVAADALEFEIDEAAGVVRDGVFYPSGKAGSFPVTMRYEVDGQQVVARSIYTVEPGAAAAIRVTPEVASVDDQPKKFRAAVTDAAHNKLGDDVTWSVVDGPGVIDDKGQLRATGDGVITIMAQSVADGKVLRSYATATVSAPEATFQDDDGDGTDDEPTHVVPHKVRQQVKDVQRTALQASIKQAEPGARIELDTAAIADPADLIVASRVSIAPQGDGPERIPGPVQGLGLVIETQPGDMGAVPEEMDAGELMANMGRGLASEPGIFLSVRGTEEVPTNDGPATIDMDSARLSQVIDGLDVRFKVPAAYFDAHNLHRHEVVLLEYSHGRQVGELTAARVGGDDLFYEFEAHLEEFSSFAIIGKAIDLVTRNDGPELGRHVLQSPLTGIQQVDMIIAGESHPVGVVPVALDDPAIQAAPTGVTKAFYVDTQADVVDMTIRVALDPVDVLDAERAVLMQHIDGAWVAASGLELRPEGAQYVGFAHTGCCGLFAIGFDNAPPVLGVAVPPKTITGDHTLRATAQDLGVASVTFLIDGQVVATDTEAPYTHRFQSARLDNGLHEITIVATDMAGNENRVRQVVATHNDPAFGQASILGAVSDSAIRGPAGGAIAMSLLFIGGSVLVLGRTRRSTMLKRRDIDASFVVEVDESDDIVAIPRRVEGQGNAVRRVHLRLKKKTTGRLIVDVDHDDEAAGTADDLIPDLLRFDLRWQGTGIDTLADVVDSITIDVEVPPGRAEALDADLSTVHFAQRPEQVDGTIPATALGGSRYRGELPSHTSWGLEAAPN